MLWRRRSIVSIGALVFSAFRLLLRVLSRISALKFVLQVAGAHRFPLSFKGLAF